ncbi:Putative permease [Halorhabdus sp. SVX81]|nr:Putative permease [Halorhabdus sp. SVX81]
MIAVFRYNRAIELPVLPAFLTYSGWRFALVLFATMVAASIVRGATIEMANSTGSKQ